MRVLSGLAVLSLAAPGLSQVALPSPAILPPPAASGAVSSPSTNPNAQWSTLLNNLLYFYEAQRSGKLPSTNRVSWRNSSALNDGSDIGKDLTGGYYDAGDYIKCTYPLSFVLTSVCWGAIEFGSGYDKAQQTPYLDDMLRWGLDWLIRAHPEENSLVVQVGDGIGLFIVDNDYWGGDQNIPTPRPSYLINSTHPGTDAAASASAAFSACSILYSGSTTTFANSAPASLSDTNYASTLRTHATQLYGLAANSSFATFTSTLPSLRNVYPSSGYQDELVLGALMLGAATNSSTLISQAISWYESANLAGSDNVFNWDSKGPGLAIMFAQLASAQSQLFPNSYSLSHWQSEAENYFDRILRGSGRGRLTDGGLLYYDGDSDEASLNPALNAAMLLLHYAPIATSNDKRSSYRSYAKNQIAYTLGNNPMSVPYVVGSNPNSPTNPHSAPASGGDDVNNINTSPPQMANVLYGAIIGGPDKTDRFFDIRNDWPETEVALDYNAPMLTLAAASVLTESDDPYFTRLQAGAYNNAKPSGTPCDAVYPCAGSHHGLSRAGVIALVVVLVVVGLVLALGFGYVCLRSRRRK
ncbi:Six-hairpin glycosidase [Ceratobasidium sp. AG-I]|nr:Six-hairpin glycosidase [Ceratobasidium sp. AG-I]